MVHLQPTLYIPCAYVLYRVNFAPMDLLHVWYICTSSVGFVRAHTMPKTPTKSWCDGWHDSLRHQPFYRVKMTFQGCNLLASHKY